MAVRAMGLLHVSGLEPRFPVYEFLLSSMPDGHVCVFLMSDYEAEADRFFSPNGE